MLTYSAASLPAGATFDPSSGTFSYNPGYDVSTRLADSFFDVSFTVTDGTHDTSQTVRIRVSNINRSPVASAGVDQQHMECAGTACPIILDGSSSTDPDSTPGTWDDIDQYDWYEGSIFLGSGKTISATLPIGVHSVSLKVKDKSGDFDEDIVTIYIDPAHLSLLVLEKAEIDWPKSTGELAEVKIHGRLALPVGLLHQEIIPIEMLSIDLAGQPGIFTQSVNFEVKGGDGDKWEYKSNNNGAGIQNLSIHWKGAKFDYKGTVHIKTEFIGLSESALAVDREGITEPLTLSVNGITATIDGLGTVISSVPYETDEDGEVTLTLPFELTPEMQITLTIGSQPPVVIPVNDYYTPGNGKFEFKARINTGSLTGVSRPATLGLNITLGHEAFPGEVSITESEWDKLSTKEWKAELK